MKSKLNPVPAAKRTQEKINNVHKGYVELMPEEAQKLVTGIHELTAKVKLKDSQITTITKQKSDLQKVVTAKTVEVQNQLKEEYISVLHQLNPKVYSANYEDWSGKAQGAKDIIDQGNFKTIRKKLPVYKQQLARKLETEKLALEAQEAERLDKAKEEVASILNQLHPALYPANFEEWSTHLAAKDSNAKRILDSGNLQAIEEKLVHYRVLLKQEVQNKAQLVLQKEQEIESLNGTFTTTISTKEEEIIAKSQLLSQTTSKLKKVSRKLAQKSSEVLSKEQEIESLRELLALKESELQEKEELLTQKDELLLAKDVEKEELVRQKDTEKQELLALKENELQEKEELLTQKDLVIVQRDELLLAKDVEKEELLRQQEREKEELLAQKNLELQNMDQLILQREAESQEKDNLLAQKDLVVVQKDELLLAKDIEKEELMRQQEREREELLAQRDRELQELEKVNNDVLIEEFIEILPQRYPDIYSKNFAEWPDGLWGKEVIDGDDIESIKHYLPIYRREVVENLTQLILAEKTKVEELLVEKANEQQRLIDKDNLLSNQTANIERINLLLETKEIIIQRLEQEKTILQTRHDILDMKMQLTVKEFTVREREKDIELKKLAESNKLLADYQEEMLKFRELCAIKDAEIREKDELLNQKELEKQELLVQKEMEKTVLVDDLQEKLHLKDSEILGLQMMVSEMNLAGEYHIVELND